jgi:hypothetical protein
MATVDYQWEQASLKHLYPAQNGEPMRARFRDSITEPWEDGWLVGWAKGERQWIGAWDFPDSLDCYESMIIGDGSELSFFKYCEVTTKQS